MGDERFLKAASRIDVVVVALACAAVALILIPEKAAQSAERHGREVVEAVCAGCHGPGLNGAPKIGDNAAWEQRRSQGLSYLTRNAVQGVRKMPAHGGSPDLSDLEIARAIAYMVNQSGGNWIEPASASELAVERSGEQVVQAQCIACHGSGTDGAPKIGDRNAWIPRLTGGVDRAVGSAIRGHGGMPPRGGRADLTDSELRSAILYMFNPQAAKAPVSAATRPTPVPMSAGGESLHRTVGGMDIYLGFAPADRLRAFPEGSVERSMHGGIPRGQDVYHVNVSLIDQKTKAAVSDANVDMRIEEPGLSSETKSLQAMNMGIASYGNFFTLRPGRRYVISVNVRSPGHNSQAHFDYQR